MFESVPEPVLSNEDTVFFIKKETGVLYR